MDRPVDEEPEPEPTTGAEIPEPEPEPPKKTEDEIEVVLPAETARAAHRAQSQGFLGVERARSAVRTAFCLEFEIDDPLDPKDHRQGAIRPLRIERNIVPSGGFGMAQVAN